ncbi:hypothetical protein HHTV1_41 [Haloarcula hispanica tailed virus 1]|uniref:Uncharacterized protein n=1 Tax=Haloarcula hispanica tailed virus 1 TaxID=1273750 RepID=R4TGD3_9CAUD|nr:hypothetical protein M198_gp42 [Haloarcula hispanica tailed virus 1]AGM11296.1 hypothetical protein HHTV1_41 [Haloarcula hispanica tailed virus 1]
MIHCQRQPRHHHTGFDPEGKPPFHRGVFFTLIVPFPADHDWPAHAVHTARPRTRDDAFHVVIEESLQRLHSGFYAIRQTVRLVLVFS